jgi:hypothetical protein
MSVNKRRVIYVDITGEENNTQFKLGLYDPEVNRVEILQLKEMSHNTEAEKYAIFYAMLYIKKHDLSNTIVLCDNKSAVNDKMVQSLAQFLKINISWIPREINTVADKVCKLETNLKDIDWNLLELFLSLYKHNSTHDNTNTVSTSSETLKKLEEEIKVLKNQLEVKNTKIQNQRKQLDNLKVKKETKPVTK